MIGIDIPMPKTCDECPMGITYAGDDDYKCYCNMLFRNVSRGKREKGCPLIDLSRDEDDLK